MARVTGPLHSSEASGQFAGALIFERGTRSCYVKPYKKPRNPRSAAQTAVRATTKYLQQLFTTLSQADQDAWAAAVWEENFSAINKYLKVNWARHIQNRAPFSNPNESEAPGKNTFAPRSFRASSFRSSCLTSY